jgi:hypothetical protein
MHCPVLMKAGMEKVGNGPRLGQIEREEIIYESRRGDSGMYFVLPLYGSVGIATGPAG